MIGKGQLTVTVSKWPLSRPDISQTPVCRVCELLLAWLVMDRIGPELANRSPSLLRHRSTGGDTGTVSTELIATTIVTAFCLRHSSSTSARCVRATYCAQSGHPIPPQAEFTVRLVTIMRAICRRMTWSTGLPLPSGLFLLVLYAPACTPYDGQAPASAQGSDLPEADSSSLDSALDIEREIRLGPLRDLFASPSPVGADEQTRRSAARGDPGAQYRLGLAYETGTGVPRDRAEALRLIHAAAENGHVPAQEGLGHRYYAGNGVPESKTDAARWFRMAAEQGNAAAQHVLGLMYANGHGVPQDPILAHMWFNISVAVETVPTATDRWGRFSYRYGPSGTGSVQLPRSSDARALIETRLTSEQIARAATMARICMDTDYRECGTE